MPKLTATDELRRMLDERGAEWSTSGNSTTRWHAGDTLFRWDVWGGRPRLLMSGITPEQAIEATLGRGTCKVVSKPSDMWECECGKAWWHGGEPNFCPNCGREVTL